MRGRFPCLFAFCIALAACGDEGYSFGEYGERIAEIGPSVDAYCVRSIECVPRAFGGFDDCRLNLLFAVYSVGAACEVALLEFFECGAQAPCIEFPTFWSDMELPGRCADETEAFLSCGDEQVAEGESAS